MKNTIFNKYFLIILQLFLQVKSCSPSEQPYIQSIQTCDIKNVATDLVNSLPKPSIPEARRLHKEQVQKLKALLNDPTFLDEDLFTIDNNDKELLKFMCEGINHCTLIKLGQENCMLQVLQEISFVEKNTKIIFAELKISDWLYLLKKSSDIVTDHIRKQNSIIKLYNNSFENALFDGSLCDDRPLDKAINPTKHKMKRTVLDDDKILYDIIKKAINPTKHKVKRTVLDDYKILYDIIKSKIQYINDYVATKAAIQSDANQQLNDIKSDLTLLDTCISQKNLDAITLIYGNLHIKIQNLLSQCFNIIKQDPYFSEYNQESTAKFEESFYNAMLNKALCFGLIIDDPNMKKIIETIIKKYEKIGLPYILYLEHNNFQPIKQELKYIIELQLKNLANILQTGKNSPTSYYEKTLSYHEKTYFIDNFSIYYNTICKKRFGSKQMDEQTIKTWKNNLHQYTVLKKWISAHHLENVLEKATEEFESKNNKLDYRAQEDLQLYCYHVTKAICSELENLFSYNTPCIDLIKKLVKQTSYSYDYTSFDAQKKIINPLEDILYEGYKPIFNAIKKYFPSISMEELTQNIKNFQEGPCRYFKILCYLSEKNLGPWLNKQISSCKNERVKKMLPQIIYLSNRFTDPYWIIRSSKNHQNKDVFFIDNYITHNILLMEFYNKLCMFVNQQSGIVDIENAINNVFSLFSISKEIHVIAMYITVMPLLFDTIKKYTDDSAVQEQIEKALLILQEKTPSSIQELLYQYKPIELIIEENKDLLEAVDTYNSIEYELKNAYIDWAKEVNLFDQSYTGEGENFERVYKFLKSLLRSKIKNDIFNKDKIDSLCSRLDKHHTLEEIKNIFNELTEEVNKQALEVNKQALEVNKQAEKKAQEIVKKFTNSNINLKNKFISQLEEESNRELEKELNLKQFVLEQRLKMIFYSLFLLTTIYKGIITCIKVT